MMLLKKSIRLLFGITILVSSCSVKKLQQDPQTNFTDNQAALITAKDSLAAMRVLKINNLSDSILLRKASEPVNLAIEDPLLPIFTKRLYQTVRDSLSMGVGIAAPQVGILKRIIWVQRFDKKGFPFEVYLNPKIVQYSKKTQKCKEGCLSIPDRTDMLETRSYAILIEYDKMDKTHHYEMIEDFTAVIFQHEIDHLDGILYTDHLEEEINAADTPSK